MIGLKGHAVLTGYNCRIYRPLERNGYKRFDFERNMKIGMSKTASTRVESMWVRSASQLKFKS